MIVSKNSLTLKVHLGAVVSDAPSPLGSCTGLGHRGCVVADAVVVQQEAAELLAAHAEAERLRICTRIQHIGATLSGAQMSNILSTLSGVSAPHVNIRAIR